MKTFLLLSLLISNAAWFASYRGKIATLQAQSETLYYDNYANDHAATECATKTGFRYNCADGAQSITCEAK